MLVRFVLWSLADSQTNVGELRRYLQDEAVDAFAEVPGLLFKAWISDEGTERWGAMYVWESYDASTQELPSRARELIGKDPDLIEVFDLEASVSVASELSRLLSGRIDRNKIPRIVYRVEPAGNGETPLVRERVRQQFLEAFSQPEVEQK